MQWRCSAVAVAALLAAQPAMADTLIDNVDGIAVDREGHVERLTGLLIGNDGRIAQVLHQGDKRPGRVDFLLDGKGRTLIPGLIDSHVDLMALGFAQLTLDLAPARSAEEAAARIAAYAAAHPDRPWILARGWNPEQIPSLSSTLASRPVWLISADGHSGWANPPALSAAGITALTKDPQGGRIGRAASKATGLLTETAMALVDRAVPPPRPEDRDLALASAQEVLLKQGITAVSDMGTTIEAWQAYRRAGDLGTLRLRILSYADGPEAMSLIGGPGPGPWLYEDRLKFNGLFLRLDGALNTRGAWLKAPYADAPTTGLPRLTGTQLRNLMSRGAIDRFQVAVEAHGDAATTAALDAITELSETYKGDRRWRLEGLTVTSAPDAARLGSTATIVALQPAALAPALAESRLGPARSADAWRWASLAGGGARIAFGSGSAGLAPNPFALMARATTRADAAGQPFGGWQPQERLTREQALAALTATSAWAGFAEGHFGRLTIGERADFLLLDRNPLMAGTSELGQTRVLESWVGGHKAWAATPGD